MRRCFCLVREYCKRTRCVSSSCPCPCPFASPLPVVNRGLCVRTVQTTKPCEARYFYPATDRLASFYRKIQVASLRGTMLFSRYGSTGQLLSKKTGSFLRANSLLSCKDFCFIDLPPVPFPQERFQELASPSSPPATFRLWVSTSRGLLCFEALVARDSSSPQVSGTTKIHLTWN